MSTATPFSTVTSIAQVSGQSCGHAAFTMRRLVERRIELQCAGIDPLDDLIGAAPFQVLEWMRRKARLADGTEVGLPVCDSGDESVIVAEERARVGAWILDGRGPPQDGWQIVEVALLRELCGATLAEAGERTRTTVSGAALRQARHQRALDMDERYAARLGQLAARALGRCHGLTGSGAEGAPRRIS